METADTKKLLLDAGKALFAQKGFNGVSVKEICDRAGVNVSLVSYHFEGKEGLYRACLEQFGREKLAAAERILESPQSQDELRLRLALFADEILRCHLEDPETSRMLHRALTMDTDIAVDIFDKTFICVFEQFVQFLQGAQAAGLVLKNIDCFIAGSTFFGALMNLTMTDKIRARRFGEALSIHNPKFRKHAQDQQVRIFLRGISTE